MAEIPPVVSVVVATNRGGGFLRAALASVHAQTYPSIELIVVDDGSGSHEEIVDAARIVPGTTIVSQPPSGPSIARNLGASLAAGRYLAFLDDDDRWHPDRLAATVARLETNPDAVVAYCGMRTIDGGGRVIVEADQTRVGDRLDVARRVTGILLPNILVRSDAFALAGGFHSRIRFAEDLDLVLRLAELGRFEFEPRALVDYRAHGDNSTRRHRTLTRGIAEILRLHRWAAAERGDHQLVGALRESIRKNDRFAWWSAGRAARVALAARRPGIASGEMLWALRTAPGGLIGGVARRLSRGRGRFVSGGTR